MNFPELPQPRPTLRIYMGLPGCGKTTAARAWCAEDPDHRIRINRDDTRATLGCLPLGSASQECAITAMHHGGAADLLTLGWSVVCDDTNLRSDVQAAWLTLAQAVGATFVLIDMTDVPVSVCINRVAQRAAGGGRDVSPHVIKTMAKRYGLPDDTDHHGRRIAGSDTFDAACSILDGQGLLRDASK